MLEMVDPKMSKRSEGDNFHLTKGIKQTNGRKKIHGV